MTAAREGVADGSNVSTRSTVLLLVSVLGYGGAERHTVTLAHLLSADYDVVLCYVQPEESLLGQIDKTRLKAVTCLHSGRGLELSAIRRLATLIDAARADVVICANSYPLLYAHTARLMTRRRFKVAVVYHTTILSTLRAKLRMVLYRPLYWMSDQLIYVCRAQKSFWLKRGLWAKRVSMIYNGVDTDSFDPRSFTNDVSQVRAEYGFSESDRVVGMCAVFRPEKSHLDLLHAVAALEQEGMRWKVLLIGDGPTRSSIEETIASLRLGGQVRISGLRQDVRPELSACDVVVLPSIAVETFSIAALEAMAMGKPMIMSDLGGAREQITDGENGFLFKPGDRDGLAACLRRCWDGDGTRRMGRLARERVKRDYSQPVMRDRYVAMLRSLLIGSR